MSASGGKPVIGLVVNPWSNKGRAAGAGERVHALLARSATVRHLYGNSPEDSVRLLCEAADTCEAVFVVGGDGMVHLAVNVLAQTDVPLGIVPAGTGNDSAEILGLPADPVAAAGILLDSLVAGRTERVDLGLCDGPALTATAPGRWFVGVLYGGFDSAVNERANHLRWPKGRSRYDVAIALGLAGLRPVAARLVLDEGTPDERILDDPITLAAIGNTRQYGGGKQITPDARWDDGIFDLTIVGQISRRRLAALAPKLPKAGHIGEPEVRTYRARTVRFEGVGIIGYADGERVGPLPLSTRVVSGALSLLVPGVGG